MALPAEWIHSLARRSHLRHINGYGEVYELIVAMAVFVTRKIQCLSLSKLCRSVLIVSRSASSTVTAVDYDERAGSSSSNSNSEHTTIELRHVPRSRRLQELATARRTRSHAATIIRDRGIALLRNPQTNKVFLTKKSILIIHFMTSGRCF